MQVVDALPRPFPDRTAHALAQMTAEKVEAPATPREIDQSRLLRMQLEPETREHDAHSLAGFLNRRFRVAHDHEIVGIADQRAEMRAPVLPDAVEDMQVNVRQQGRDDAALRRACL